MKCRPKLSDLTVNGVCVTDDKSKAIEFNKQFSSVFATSGLLAYDIAPPPLVNILDDNIIISCFMVEKSLRSFDGSHSHGPDGIPSIFLKTFARQLSAPLQMIFQKSFDTGCIPNDFKCAHVVPIFKRKGQSSDPVNYRPVSLTSVCCKAFEKILKSFLVSHLKVNNVYNY